MRDLGQLGVGVLPGGEELLIHSGGNLVSAGLFTGECDPIKSKSGMRTVHERSLESRFGIGPLPTGEHGGAFAFTHRPDVVWRLTVA